MTILLEVLSLKEFLLSGRRGIFKLVMKSKGQGHVWNLLKAKLKMTKGRPIWIGRSCSA
ncbi:unnamed protein product [Prunus brigantina]